MHLFHILLCICDCYFASMNQLLCNLLSKSDFALSPITVTLFSCHTLVWYKIKQYETTKVLYVQRSIVITPHTQCGGVLDIYSHSHNTIQGNQAMVNHYPKIHDSDGSFPNASLPNESFPNMTTLLSLCCYVVPMQTMSCKQSSTDSSLATVDHVGVKLSGVLAQFQKLRTCLAKSIEFNEHSTCVHAN